MPYTRGYVSGRFMLELDGKNAGFLVSVEGGEPMASVVAEPPDPDGVVRKHLGALEYAPISISFGTGMSESLYQWIGDWLTGKAADQSGAVVFLDYNFLEQSRLEFDNALITEFAVPELDASSKATARFTLTLQPEQTRVGKASAGTKSLGLSGKSSKAWTVSNFKLTIGNLQTAKVNSIDALVVKRAIVRDDPRHVAEPQPLEIPDLVFTMPEKDAGDMVAWFEDFAVKGNNDEKNERSGTLALLGPNVSTTLFTLTLSNLGIHHIHRERSDAGAEVVARVRVAAYCERIGFTSAPEARGVPASAPSNAPTAPNETPDALQAWAIRTLLAGRLQDAGASSARLTVADVAGGAATDPQLIAGRLLATVRPDGGDPSASPRRNDGVAIGTRWATESASLDELEQMASLEPRDWTAVRLEPPHSLIDLLVAEGVLPVGADEAPIELERDSFVEGIVVGAAQVFRGVRPHLRG